MDKGKPVQCIGCGARSDDKTNRVLGWSSMPFLKELSEEKQLDYWLILCDACAIGLALLGLGASLDREGSTEYKIVSDALCFAGEKFFIDYNRRRF